MTKHHAQCQCGQLSASSDAEPDYVVACNCKACQLRTGAVFGAGLYFKKSDLTLKGKTSSWSRKADSGRDLENFFCPECGTTLYWSLEMRPDHMGVAYGAFHTDTPEPTRAIWTENQHDWVSFPEDWPTYSKAMPT